MLLGFLFGGYVAAPADDLAAESEWQWGSTGELTFVPLVLAADDETVWASTGDATVATPVTLAAASTWAWVSTGDIDELERGPRGTRGNRAGVGAGRFSEGGVGVGGRRVTVGTAGIGAGR